MPTSLFPSQENSTECALPTASVCFALVRQTRTKRAGEGNETYETSAARRKGANIPGFGPVSHAYKMGTTTWQGKDVSLTPLVGHEHDPPSGTLWDSVEGL